LQRSEQSWEILHQSRGLNLVINQGLWFDTMNGGYHQEHHLFDLFKSLKSTQVNGKTDGTPDKMTTTTSGKGKQQRGNHHHPKLPEWRYQKKEPTIEHEGKSYYWCNHHCFYTDSHETKDCKAKKKKNAKGKTPLELFSTVAMSPAPRHFHPFGCPVYVLTEWMQSDRKGPKWEERA
jgi:hypothetical protein